jgi:phosphatidate cytidylyltransferase
MLRERILVATLLLPIAAWVVAAGGWVYTIAVALIVSIAIFEYVQLFQKSGFKPAVPVAILGVISLVGARYLSDFQVSGLALSAFILVAMLWHLLDYERGASRSGTEFAITVAGVIYLGWIGAYLISVRMLPEGEWWIFLVLPAVWIADTAAYVVGSWIGHHSFAPRLSPKKTWEGYLAGVLFGTLSGAGLATLWGMNASAITPSRGGIIGFVMGVLAPMGDLGVSMIKRELGAKDTGSLLPGHGGVLDRIDSWLWAGVLGYYLILWFS